MTTPPNAAELLESLDRHFIAGCPRLTASQFRSHQSTGTCRDCRERAQDGQAAVANQPVSASIGGIR